MSATLTRTPGDHRFRVEGRTLYDHWEATSATAIFPGNEQTQTFKVEVAWSFTIDLLMPPASSSDFETPNGVIKPKVLGVDSTGLPKDVRMSGKRPEYILDDTPTKVMAAIRNNISGAVKKTAESLEGKFDYSGRFVYPESSKVCLADELFLVCSHPGHVQVRPPGYMKYEVPAERKPQVIVTSPLLRGDVNASHVIWQVGVPAFDPNTKRVKISLTGSNITGHNVGFSCIKVVVPAIKDLNFSAVFAECDPKKRV
ncbi:hypothetical protein MMYC01_204294 [Madurella mycetomatis]|uniref:Uncharacterized protein n=1 Tax=Madurella mycetomatis TaxID=100816 RepID=A0A175W2G5_9PEZI|nr:hypothetical protein MMYC01_206594 [Madurella mycetomatis]KXX79000.1 hypothetical protein MMYC01_204294 [Madurella mycetomatis]